MNLEEIDIMLAMLKRNSLSDVLDFLKEERQKILSIETQLHNKEIIESFDKYMSECMIIGDTTFKNLYFSNNEFTMFTNGVSIFKLNRTLLVSEKLKKIYKPDTNPVHLINRTSLSEFEKIFNKCERMIINPILVNDSSVILSKNKFIIKCGNVNREFNFKQIMYLKKFIGTGSKMYVSDTAPIIFGESEVGKSYVLGFK